ncbi:MAG: alpha/beta hydrolase [Candidatus Komeilibacteria bacterium]|nr:alpha/beta hydrolase [Candidatus Komeilibacteria bacterium]
MKVIVQNLSLEYQDQGQGLVLLLLPGWQDNLKTFDDLVPLLSKNRIIIKGAAKNELLAQKIVLIASAGLAKIRTWRNSALMVVTKIGKFITLIPPFSFWRKELRKKLYQNIGSDYFSAGSLRQIFLNVVREDLSAWAGQIKQPALLIWGDQDTETPLPDGQRLVALIKKANLQVIKGTNHFVHQQQPEAVGKLIEEFLC